MTTLATRSAVSATHAVTQLAIRLTSGDKDPIRGMKAPDGRTVFSVYDAMWNTGAYATRDAVTSAWTTLLLTDFGEVVRASATYVKFPGRGQRDTPCMDIRGLQRLIICLGGKIGAEYRRLAETTLTRLIAGDESMISEIESNAASDAPIQTLAREALAYAPLLADAPPAAKLDGDAKAETYDDTEDDEEDERMVLVRNIAASVATLGQQSSGLAADVRQFAPLVPVVQRLTEEVALLRIDRDHQARLRHQADGRYGSEVREANKGVRDLADHWRRQAEKHEKRSDEKDQMILECHRLFAGAMAKHNRERSRSPRSPRPSNV